MVLARTTPMHLFTRARVPDACLPSADVTALSASSELEPWTDCDILVDQDRIVGVRVDASPDWTGTTPPPATASTDLCNQLTWPGLVDAHTHLDKTFTWSRAPNPRGEFWDAIKILHDDARQNWTAEDLYQRADFALRTAWAHGTIALRTHLDSGPDIGAESHAVMSQLRAEWAGRITLQLVSMGGVRSTDAPSNQGSLDLARDHGATALGGFPRPNPDLPQQLDRLLEDATALGLGVDLHVDENGLADAECLRAIAEAVLRSDFPHPVTCGHNCSLSVHDDPRAAETVALVREAGIHIISLPLCNLYLQGRKWDDTGRPLTPQWRGLTRLHEFAAAGVPVSCGSDNVRDAFFAWGDYDLWEVFQAGVRIGHFDTRMPLAPAMVTTHPADLMGLPTHGRIAPGSPADLVVSPARTGNEFLARPTAGRRLIHGESFRPAEPPAFAELDSLLSTPSLS